MVEEVDIVAITMAVLIVIASVALIVMFIINIFVSMLNIKKGLILIEQQNDLLSKIDVTLIGIDCRLQNLEEKNSGG